MSTIGVAPPDFTDVVGQFRLLVGDTNATSVAAGQGTYALFSDEEINGYLLLESNLYRAVAMGLTSLGNQAANEAESIKDYDLAVDRRARAEEFREQAKAMLERAQIADMDGDEGFQIVPTGRRLTRPERLAQDVQAILNGDWPI